MLFEYIFIFWEKKLFSKFLVTEPLEEYIGMWMLNASLQLKLGVDTAEFRDAAANKGAYSWVC